MNVKDLIEKTGWQNLSTEESSLKEINGVYVGDLLSWVMGNGNPEEVWITVQAHINVIAVAILREFSCIVIADYAQIPDDVIARAKEENLAILVGDTTAFGCAKKCIELGL